MNGGTGTWEAALAARELGRRALSLGAANAFDYVVQFVLPVVLVRYLDPAAFGQYRLLWLAVGTVMAIVTQAMAGSLYYFLPRSCGAAKRLYINQTLLYLAVAGLIGAWTVSPWNPWLSDKIRDLTQHQIIVPAFVLLWVVASLLDLIATAEERVAWQAKATIGLSLLRTMVLSLSAILTRQLEPVLWALLAFVGFKVALLLVYVAKHHGLRGPFLRWREFADQLRQSAPFGASGALYGLRTQADQWVASSLFSLGLFASFSVAAVLGPLVQVCRQSVLHAFLPSVSRLQAAKDISGMIELNSRANVMVAELVYPLLGFAFAFSQEIVTAIYTTAYADASPVMRIYIVGLVALAVELATILLLLRQGAFTLALGLVMLILSVTVSWGAAQRFGLAGAALGSVTVVYVDLIATLWRISVCTGIPFRRLQDWRSLGKSLLSAALAALLAWSMVDRHIAADAPLLRLSAGGLILAAAYCVTALLFGTCRNWFAAIRAAGTDYTSWRGS